MFEVVVFLACRRARPRPHGPGSLARLPYTLEGVSYTFVIDNPAAEPPFHLGDIWFYLRFSRTTPRGFIRRFAMRVLAVNDDRQPDADPVPANPPSTAPVHSGRLPVPGHSPVTSLTVGARRGSSAAGAVRVPIAGRAEETEVEKFAVGLVSSGTSSPWRSDVNPKPKPPMPGGEHTQFIDTGPQGISPGATRVNLIPVGDGGPGPLLPSVTRRRKPKPMLPSEAEIASLPRLARVAFAVRCIARVQPLTTGTAQAGESPDAAVAAAAVAIPRLSPPPGDPVLFRHDFDRLRKLAKQHNWTDDTPVVRGVGPLWPGRVPKWAGTNEPRVARGPSRARPADAWPRLTSSLPAFMWQFLYFLPLRGGVVRPTFWPMLRIGSAFFPRYPCWSASPPRSAARAPASRRSRPGASPAPAHSACCAPRRPFPPSGTPPPSRGRAPPHRVELLHALAAVHDLRVFLRVTPQPRRSKLSITSRCDFHALSSCSRTSPRSTECISARYFWS